MKYKDIQVLLTSVSGLLTAINNFPAFEEVVENDSYYTMKDQTLSDATQILNDITQGMENVNTSDKFSDFYLTQDLETAITSVAELSVSIVLTDRSSRLSEGKVVAKKPLQDSSDSRGCNV